MRLPKEIFKFPFSNQILMLTNILIFTGAGASVQFSKPDTSEFRQQLSQKYEGSDLMKSFLDCPGFEDIEHVLESLKDFELAHNNHMTQYLKNAVLPGIASNTIDFFKNLTNQRDNLRSDIMSDLFQTYKWDGKNDDEKTRKFYADLFNIVSKYSSKVYVGTTNYDQAIEQGCALSNLKYECIDGFEYFKNDISKWNGKKFTEEYNGQGMPVYLYKIHGSLTWKHDGSGNIEKNTRDITYERGSGQNVLIAPTLSPKTAQSKEPFKTLLTELENKLENVDVCIVIGFSFRDKHVGELFQKFIENGKNFIVISPSSFINYCENLFDKKLISDEARNAWFRQHRTGKNIHFISERINEDNNGNVFKQLEETLSKISKTIITSNTKNDKKINQNLSDPLNKNELSQKEKDELVQNVYRPCFNQLDSIARDSDFLTRIPANPWDKLEPFWKFKTEPEIKELFEEYELERSKWHKMWVDFGNKFQSNIGDIAKILDPVFKKLNLIDGNGYVLFGNSTMTIANWLQNCMDVIFNDQIQDADKLYDVLKTYSTKKWGEEHAKGYESWKKNNPSIYVEIIHAIPEMVKTLNANYSYQEIDFQRNLLRGKIEYLEDVLKKKLEEV